MPANRLVLSNGVFVFVTQQRCQPVEVESIKYDNTTGAIIRDENGEPIKTTYINSKCAQILVDANGQKAPNQLGRDVFVVFVDQQKYYYPNTVWTGDIETIVSQGKFSDKLEDYDVNANFGE